MILVDVNLLIYATSERLPQYPAANAWLSGQLNGSARVGLPWSSLLGYLRIVTNPRAFSNALRMHDAWEQIRSWLNCDVVWVPSPTERHVDILSNLVALPGVYGELVPDADLAALEIEHGLILCSTDGDFARFPGLKWMNPLTT